MNRRDFLRTASLGSIGTFLSGDLPNSHTQTTQQGIRPNVILVITDDQGYGDLACHGNPIIRTPNIDQFYNESVRLTNFHVDPTCAPTRSALMTGRYSCRTGVWHTVMGRSLLRQDEITMGDMFTANGYSTCVTGKWHLGDNYPFRPEYRGFHETLSHGGGGISQSPDYWGNDYFDDTYRYNGNYTQFTGYCTDVFFAQAIDFIERHPHRPFFLYLPTNAPHGPLNVPAEYSQPYIDLGVPENRAKFYGMITNIDDNMGTLLQRLHDLGIEDNTIVIFMTDNGTSKGDFTVGMRGKKSSEYDGGHRVPCFIRWPGKLETGKDVDRITAHIDLLPTLIELCGLNPPEDVEFDGTSLVALLEGDGTGWLERTLFVQRNRMEVPEPWTQSAVMTDKWRLVNKTELYDMDADPGQTTNVASLHPSVVAALQTAYLDWYADVSERFDEYCEIVLGSIENPTTLCAHDWHEKPVWSQSKMEDGSYFANGFWAVELARSGLYQFTLRQRPSYVYFPIEGTSARIQIDDADEIQSITSGATGVTFTLDLEAGKHILRTWFYQEGGAYRGAYYVEVNYVGGNIESHSHIWHRYL